MNGRWALLGVLGCLTPEFLVRNNVSLLLLTSHHQWVWPPAAHMHELRSMHAHVSQICMVCACPAMHV